MSSPIARELTAAGTFAGSRVLDAAESASVLRDLGIKPGAAGMVIEHERVPFPSFPSEWAPEMLHGAADLTLKLCGLLLRDGLGLKDATPYNVLFRGPRGVFVDLLSVERRDANDPLWVPEAQFVRTFLLPLLAWRKFNMSPDQIFLSRRDGIEPDEFYRWCGPLQRLLPPVLTLCSIPAWLHTRADSSSGTMYAPKRLDDAEKAKFIFSATLRRLRRNLDSLQPDTTAHSQWSGYMDKSPSYTQDEFATKDAFVREALREFQPRTVLDVGCNTGHFSIAAAQSGASVVAIDYDPAVIGRLWRRASAEGLDILPLIVSLSRPTPALGWRNREQASFLDRARGKFDAVLMLAVLHHIMVTDGIPLNEIVDTAAELTTGICIAEFVGPGDPLFIKLLRGRNDLYADLDRRAFEQSIASRFTVVRCLRLGQKDRWLYVLSKNGS